MSIPYRIFLFFLIPTFSFCQVNECWNNVNSLQAIESAGPIMLSKGATALAVTSNASADAFIGFNEYSRGKVIAIGHETFLTDSYVSKADNLQFLENSIKFLRKGTNRRLLIYDSPWANKQLLKKLDNKAHILGMTSESVNYSDFGSLDNVGVLIIGNSWKELSTSDIRNVIEYVEEGGGLILAGLGWSWSPNNGNKSLAEYPINVLGKYFGFEWQDGYLNERKNKLGTDVVLKRSNLPTSNDCKKVSEESLTTGPPGETNIFVYTNRPHGTVTNQFRYRTTGQTNWTETNQDNKHYKSLGNLKKGTDYTFQVRHKCENRNWLDYSGNGSFKTKGQAEEEECQASRSESLTVSEITETQATLRTVQPYGNVTNQFRYRTKGSSSWKETSQERNSQRKISGLKAGTDYEYEIRHRCNDRTWLDYGGLRKFKTKTRSGDGVTTCKSTKPESLTTGNPGETQVFVYTSQPYGTVTNQFRYRTTGQTNWTETNQDNKHYKSLGNLKKGTDYTFQVRHKCENRNWLDYSGNGSFKTKGQAEEEECQASRSESLTVSEITETQATLRTVQPYGNVTNQFRYRSKGSSSWKETSQERNAQRTISGLKAGTDYEYEVRHRCNDRTWLDYGSRNNFKTKAESDETVTTCKSNNAESLTTGPPGETNVFVYTNQPYGAVTNQVRYRTTSQTNWTETPQDNKHYKSLQNLKKGTSYIFQVRHKCENRNWLDYSGNGSFKTKGQAVEEEDCLPSSTELLTTTNIKETEATLKTSQPYGGLLNQFRYKTIGSTNWKETSKSKRASRYISNLKAGVNYEFQVRYECNGRWTAYGSSARFSTNSESVISNNFAWNQCQNTGKAEKINIELSRKTSVYIRHNEPYGSILNTLEYRRKGDSNWIKTAGSTKDFKYLSGLDEETRYEVRFKYECSDGVRYSSSNKTFLTGGVKKIEIQESLCRRERSENIGATNIYDDMATLTTNKSYGGVPSQFLYKPNNQNEWSLTEETWEGELLVGGLEPNTSYTYKVQHYCEGKWQSPSSTKTFRTQRTNNNVVIDDTDAILAIQNDPMANMGATFFSITTPSAEEEKKKELEKVKGDKEKVITSSDINYELAYTYKLLADELFIEAGNWDQFSEKDGIIEKYQTLVDQAEDNYNKAYDILKDPVRINPNHWNTGAKPEDTYLGGPELSKDLYQLLLKEVLYRKKLIDSGLEFWGLEFTRYVDLPVLALNDFVESYKSFIEVYDEMDDVRKGTNIIREANQLARSKKLESTYEFNINKISEEQNEAIEEVKKAELDSYAQRERDIEKIQDGLNSRSEALNDQINDLEQSISSQAVDLVSNYIGVPPMGDAASMFAGGKIDPSKLTETITSQFGGLEGMEDFSNSLGVLNDAVTYGPSIIKLIQDPDDDEALELLGELFPNSKLVADVRDYHAWGQKVVKTGENFNENCIDDINGKYFECFTELVDTIIKIDNGANINPELKKQWESARDDLREWEIDEKLPSIIGDIQALIDKGDFDALARLAEKFSNSPGASKEFKDTWEKLNTGYERFKIARKTGNLLDYLKVGDVFIENNIIDSDEFDKILASVRNGSPGGLLLEYGMKKDNPIAKRVQCNLNEYAYQQDLRSVHSSNFKNLAASDPRMMDDISSNLYYRELINASPESLYLLLDANAENKLSNTLGTTTLNQNYFNEAFVSQVEKIGSSFFYGDVQLPDIDLLKKTVKSRVNHSKDDLSGFTAIVGGFTNKLEDFSYGADQLNEIITEIGNQRNLFQFVSSSLTEEELEIFYEVAARVQIGLTAIHGTPDGRFKGVQEAIDLRQASMASAVSGAGSVDQDLKIAEMAVMTGIQSVCAPCAAGVKLLKSYNELFSKASELNEITKDRKSNERQLFEIARKISALTLASSLAELEQEKDELRMKISDHRRSFQSDLMKGYTEDLKANQEYLTNLLRLFFFESEMLRFRRSHLEKTILFWHRKTIDEIIKDDPKFERMGLDKDIRLFDWLTLDQAGMRGNIDLIFHQWSTYKRLIENNKDRLVSYDKFNRQIAQTDVLNLSQIVDSENWKNFEAWQNNRISSPFTLEFSIPVNAIRDYVVPEARVMDIILGAVDKNGKPDELNRADIKPKVDYVIANQFGEFRNEAYKAFPIRSASRYHSYQGGYSRPDFDDHEKRWLGNDQNFKVYDYEGLGVYSKWDIILDASEFNFSLSDITMRLAYYSRSGRPTLKRNENWSNITVIYDDNVGNSISWAYDEILRMGYGEKEFILYLEGLKEEGSIKDYRKIYPSKS